MKKTTVMVLLFFCVSMLHSQHIRPAWDDQPQELREIYLEARELGKKSNFRLPKVRAPQFVKRVVALKKRIDRYTIGHSEKDLNWFYWGTAFRDTYRLAGTQLAQGYPAAERILTEGVELLSDAQSDNPLTVPHVILHMYVFHIHNYVESNPVECARLWDNAGRWVKQLDISDLTGIWQFHRATVESRLLSCAANLTEGRTATASRARIIANYIADDTVPMRHRSTALRCFVNHLHRSGEVRKASPLIEKIRNHKGATPDYYYSRMLVALFGEGDWEKATWTLDMLNNAASGANMKPSDRRMQEKTLDLYYGNLFLPDVELLRRGAAGETQ